MSHARRDVSRVTCHVSHIYIYIYWFIYFWTKRWSLLVEGLLSTGPTPSSFYLSMVLLKFSTNKKIKNNIILQGVITFLMLEFSLFLNFPLLVNPKLQQNFEIAWLYQKPTICREGCPMGGFFKRVELLCEGYVTNRATLSFFGRPVNQTDGRTDGRTYGQWRFK